MSIHKSIAKVFENNMSNRITPELAGGMIRSLVDILAASVQPPTDDKDQAVDKTREGCNGLV